MVLSPWKMSVSPKWEWGGSELDTAACGCSLQSDFSDASAPPCTSHTARTSCQQLVEESCNLRVRDFRPRFSAFWLQINNAFLTFQVHSQNILSSSRLLTSCAEEIYYSLRNWWVSYSFSTDWLVLNIYILYFHTILVKKVNLFTLFLRQRKT